MKVSDALLKIACTYSGALHLVLINEKGDQTEYNSVNKFLEEVNAIKECKVVSLFKIENILNRSDDLICFYRKK